MSVADELEKYQPTTTTHNPMPGPVQELLKHLGHANDRLDRCVIDRSQERVYLSVSWGCRGSMCDADYIIPLWVLEADDVEKAVVLWKLEKRLEELEMERQDLEEELRYTVDELERIEKELTALGA